MATVSNNALLNALGNAGQAYGSYPLSATENAASDARSKNIAFHLFIACNGYIIVCMGDTYIAPDLASLQETFISIVTKVMLDNAASKNK